MSSFTVNGQPVHYRMDPDTPLLWALRDASNLTGTKYGCGTGHCGACTVHVDGNAVRSCMVPIRALEGSFVTTIEGLAEGDELHPLQRAFMEHHGLQCGYCTPGMVMAALGLVADDPDLDERRVREGLEGNLCRCTGYHNIVQAVLAYARTARS